MVSRAVSEVRAGQLVTESPAMFQPTRQVCNDAHPLTEMLPPLSRDIHRSFIPTHPLIARSAQVLVEMNRYGTATSSAVALIWDCSMLRRWNPEGHVMFLKAPSSRIILLRLSVWSALQFET